MKRENKKNIKSESVGTIYTGNLNKKILISVGVLVGIIVLLVVFVLIFNIVNEKSECLGSESEEYNSKGVINGDKGYIYILHK